MSIVYDASVQVREWQLDPKKMIEALFEQLGKPEHAGHAFAITPAGAKGIDMEKLPHPDYEHRVYRDRRTDNHLVVRPDASGGYGEIKHYERLR
jgi:hypothetical protein